MESPFVYASSYIRPYAAEQAFLARSEMEALSVTLWAYILEDIPDKCKPPFSPFHGQESQCPSESNFRTLELPRRGVAASEAG